MFLENNIRKCIKLKLFVCFGIYCKKILKIRQTRLDRCEMLGLVCVGLCIMLKVYKMKMWLFSTVYTFVVQQCETNT